MPFASVRVNCVLTTGLDVSIVSITATDGGTDTDAGSIVFAGRIRRRVAIAPTERDAGHDDDREDAGRGSGGHPLAGFRGEEGAVVHGDLYAAGRPVRLVRTATLATATGPLSAGQGCRRPRTQDRSTSGRMSSRSPRNCHISLRIVVITDGELRVDSPLVRGK